MLTRNRSRRAAAAEPVAPVPTSAAAAVSPTPALDALIESSPDLVDRIFDYVVELLPEIAARRAEIKTALREEFGAQEGYIRRRELGPDSTARAVLAMFNGRNAFEVARRLNISVRSVHRYIKQAGDNQAATKKLRQTSLEMAQRRK